MKSVHDVKCVKVVRMDCIAFEFLEKGDDCVLDWLVRIFNICMGHDDVMASYIYIHSIVLVCNAPKLQPLINRPFLGLPVFSYTVV